MASISPISGNSYTSGSRIQNRHQTENHSPDRKVDEVRLSDRARNLSRLSRMPDVRHELVDRVKAEIQAGTYVTDEKIDTAIERMSIDLTA
ncbi:MAG TPA: flagellar biosynthesis anti-sigma factor FlgM [Phycisphaeraceae bacterium]|nr:flagellar biosynthesis anti-sigma factor FlgM [Phycisphaeraceae bacterium]